MPGVPRSFPRPATVPQEPFPKKKGVTDNANPQGNGPQDSKERGRRGSTVPPQPEQRRQKHLVVDVPKEPALGLGQAAALTSLRWTFYDPDELPGSLSAGGKTHKTGPSSHGRPHMRRLLRSYVTSGASGSEFLLWSVCPTITYVCNTLVRLEPPLSLCALGGDSYFGLGRGRALLVCWRHLGGMCCGVMRGVLVRCMCYALVGALPVVARVGASS